MSAYFKRQLADYVEYHRDPWNCAMHVFGIIALFFAAILPLSLWPIGALGVHTTLATIMVLPVLAYWLVLDAAIGTAILGAAVVLLSAAAFVVNHASLTVVWSVTAMLIVIGIVRKLPAARYAALGLLSVTLVKLFFHDLAQLKQLYRIGAFMGVAVIAMLASFAYQRFFTASLKEKESKDENPTS